MFQETKTVLRSMVSLALLLKNTTKNRFLFFLFICFMLIFYCIMPMITFVSNTHDFVLDLSSCKFFSKYLIWFFTIFSKTHAQGNTKRAPFYFDKIMRDQLCLHSFFYFWFFYVVVFTFGKNWVNRPVSLEFGL